MGIDDRDLGELPSIARQPDGVLLGLVLKQTDGDGRRFKVSTRSRESFDAAANALKAVLAEDPRPGYQDDPEREYGFFFADKEVSFKVQNGILTVTQITEGNCAHND